MASFEEKKSFRIGWEDVVPVPQSDGPNPVASINYSTDFRELMDLFRAVLVSGEKTQRVLELTEEILDTNAANYTVWEYRRQTLQAMDSNLVIVQRLGDAKRELDFTRAVFEVDGKNYHAWSHRQWTLVTFGLWDGELTFVDDLLEEDIRNNSAWNQRWFAVHRGNAEENALCADSLMLEFEYTMRAIDKVKSNESAWNYLRGLWRKYRGAAVSGGVLFSDVLERRLCELNHQWLEELQVKETSCLLLLELLADILESGPKRESHKGTIVEMFGRLQQLDAIRSVYWQQRACQCQ